MFTRQSSRRSLSTNANKINDADPNLSQLIIYSNENYGIEYPKTHKELLELKKTKNIQDFVFKGKIKIHLKNSVKGSYLAEKDTEKRILPIENWLSIVQKAHGEKHNKAESIVDKLTGYMIPVEAVYYLITFCCSQCFTSEEELNESVLVLEKKSKMGSFGKIFKKLL